MARTMYDGKVVKLPRPHDADTIKSFSAAHITFMEAATSNDLHGSYGSSYSTEPSSHGRISSGHKDGSQKNKKNKR